MSWTGLGNYEVLCRPSLRGRVVLAVERLNQKIFVTTIYCSRGKVWFFCKTCLTCGTFERLFFFMYWCNVQIQISIWWKSFFTNIAFIVFFLINQSCSLFFLLFQVFFLWATDVKIWFKSALYSVLSSFNLFIHRNKKCKTVIKQKLLENYISSKHPFWRNSEGSMKSILRSLRL